MLSDEAMKLGWPVLRKTGMDIAGRVIRLGGA
jgi:hypothetical protein